MVYSTPDPPADAPASGRDCMAARDYIEEWLRKSEEDSKHSGFVSIMFYLAFLSVNAVFWLLWRNDLLIIQGVAFAASGIATNLLSKRSEAKRRRKVAEVLRAVAWMFNVDTSTCIGVSKVERRRRLKEPLPGRRYRLVCFGDEPIGIVDDGGNYVDVEDLAKHLERIRIWR